MDKNPDGRTEEEIGERGERGRKFDLNSRKLKKKNVQLKAGPTAHLEVIPKHSFVPFEKKRTKFKRIQYFVKFK